ncbi:MAG TPA: DUF3788 family protein [Bacteroidales bacterium]|nr:DUF3788 family protein [Bacteroidales bacterium]
MAEKELLALSNPNIRPGDDLVFSLIGDKKVYWQQILKHLSENYKDITWSWNWYNDGKQWLFKLVQKKKTILWSGILSTGQFRMTFYFGDKAEPVILSSDIPQKVKDEFVNGQRYGKIRAITILVNSPDDVETVLKTAAIKIKLK